MSKTPKTYNIKPTVVTLNQHSRHEVELLAPIVNKIDVLRPMTAMISDDDLKNKHLEFKARLAAGETLDDILIDAFAVVREATNRVRHTPHYPEQLLGGILLHQGRVAEMRTGEGKTQTCLLPAYLNALEGKGVHVVTCNDYLAARDAEEMALVHNALGLTVGCVTKDTPPENRKAQYACDITYVTNNELAFDYLRDNMAIYKEEQVLRELNYCIIDEVDSVLIDEARMPLRISGRNDQDLSLYEPANDFVLGLERGEVPESRSKIEYILDGAAKETGDYYANDKDNIINLTSQGVTKAEEYFGVENLADPENLEIIHHINLALRANYLLERDVDYMVKDGEILIIDEFTGRAAEGRKFSDGLHQAIEAKEGLKVNQESITIASVTFQNFFNKYKKKGGMTGTGQSEEREFRDVYYMDVVTVPTHRPILRLDYPDAVYKTHKEKVDAVVEEVIEAHEKGQPVLVGTVSVEGSEEISNRLKEKNIEHNVLNAKLLELEAEIVSHSGEFGAVTIATNMAGRGTDIKIDEKARAAGGLKVIGTERHESRRIDDQLRGRSGRQGDVGESQFIISLEDEVLKHYGSERLISLYEMLGFKEGERLQHKTLHRTIERAQGKVEYNNYGIRKNVLEYDKVLNEQREIIYEERDRILTEDNIHPSICRLIEHVLQDAVDMVVGEDMVDRPDMWDWGELNALILPIIPIKPVSFERLDGNSRRDLEIQLKLEALNLYEDKIGEYGHINNVDEIEKVVLLKCIDSKWTRHIEDMDQLKRGINLQNYSGKDPITTYKFLAYDMFDEMIRGIREDAIYILYRARFGREAKRERVASIVDQINTAVNATPPGYVRKHGKKSDKANAGIQDESGYRADIPGVVSEDEPDRDKAHKHHGGGHGKTHKADRKKDRKNEENTSAENSSQTSNTVRLLEISEMLKKANASKASADAHSNESAAARIASTIKPAASSKRSDGIPLVRLPDQAEDSPVVRHSAGTHAGGIRRNQSSRSARRNRRGPAIQTLRRYDETAPLPTLTGAAGLDDVMSGAERPVDTDLDQWVADTGSDPVRTAEADAVARENMKSAKAFSEESAHSLKAVPVAGIGEWAMSKKKTNITDDDEE